MAEKSNNMTIRMDDEQLARVDDWVERSGTRSRNGNADGSQTAHGTYAETRSYGHQRADSGTGV